MRIPKLSETEIRALASNLGVEVAEVVKQLHAPTQEMWKLLRSSLDGTSPMLDAIDATVVSLDLSFARIAETEKDGDRPKVRVHLGLLNWCYVIARALTPYFTGADEEVGATNFDIERTALLIAYPLGWLTSPARHVREAIREPLSEEQEVSAERLADAAVLFVLAHEMGHVAVGDLVPEQDIEASHAREHAADAWAIHCLFALAKADINWPLGLTLSGAALFLCAEGLREAYAEQLSSPTHPSAIKRLEAVTRILLEAGDFDGRSNFGKMAILFRIIFPYVLAIAPVSSVSTSDLREMVRLAGQDPLVVPDNLSLTWREVYDNEVVEAMRALSRISNRDLNDAEVAELEALVHRMPAVVIERLTEAYEGRLLPQDDPDAPAVHALGQRIVARFSDPILREAIITG